MSEIQVFQFSVVQGGGKMRKFLTAAVTLLLLVSTYTFSQTSNAQLGGTVSDATGALIPGVSVTLTNTATGVVNTTVSNEAGAYNFPSIQTGAYKVSAELPGFQTQTYNDVTLGISQQVRLNFTLQVGSVSQAVEVTVSADNAISTTSASVGTVLPEYRVRDLPLGGRNVLDLLTTTGGTGPTEGITDGYFAGGRLSAVNTTRDGFVVSDGRYNHGAYSATYVSPDLVEEVRVITAPVDAEAGRGAGQIQMVTRSGTNQFRGSVFWNNRNSAMDASSWFNNFNGAPKDWSNRNVVGGRIGGPIVKNKTFFFGLYESQRDVVKRSFVGPALTAQARQGIFRFYPGADNQNAIGIRPTVDRNGNPVQPSTATGPLQQFSVFNRDPFRPGFDPSGFIQNTLLARMPVANDFTSCGPQVTGVNCDGLNVAGHRWVQRVSGQDESDGNGGEQANRDQFNTRVDHNFSQSNKLSVIYTWERDLDHTAQAGIAQWPGGYDGANNRWPRVFTGSLVSTLSSTMVNELRIGYKLTKQFSWNPFYVGRADESEETGAEGKEAFALLPQKNGVPYSPITTLFTQNIMNWGANAGSTRFTISPQYTYGDTLSWSKGAHSFKGGFELRMSNTESGGDTQMTPQVVLGAGGVPVANIDNVAIPGLSANNQTVARNLLTDLSGSVNHVLEGFDLRDTRNPKFTGYKDGSKYKLRQWFANEISMFVKDTWKASSNLTLNYGIHWEYFGVPYEAKGLTGRPVGVETGLCGISCGSLTSIEFVGKNSLNPDKTLYNRDLNNLAPSVGFSWSLPWGGQDKTVLRVGYGWSITGGPLKGASTFLNYISGGLPGTFGGFSNTGWTDTQAAYRNLSTLTLPIAQQFAPFTPTPLTGSREDEMMAYATKRLDPYIQNFNFELQRQVSRDLNVSVAYIGTKGTKLWGALPLNAVNINAGLPGGQTFLDAFNVTRAGGNAPLFDQMLRGLNIPGAGVVNGTTVTGSAALRAYTSTRAFLANGGVGQLADFLNRSRNVTNQGGGFVRNSGLFPENFFVLNPQFNLVTYHTNPSSSTYHSVQVQATKQLSQGFSNQVTYTLSRGLGDNDGESYINARNPNNRSQDKTLLGFHRTHAFSSNGMYQLPFGAGQPFLANAPGFVQRIVERWQLGGIFSYTSGAPLNVTAQTSSIWQTATQMTPVVVGDFAKNVGKVTKLANAVSLFPGIQQINDPSVSGVSAANALSGSFSNKAITDASGNLLLVNPSPGQVGTLGLRWVEGPSLIGFDANLIKRVRITETKEFEFRLDGVNLLNHPNFVPPTAANLNINSLSFGRITTASGSRRFVVNARLNF